MKYEEILKTLNEKQLKEEFEQKQKEKKLKKDFKDFKFHANNRQDLRIMTIITKSKRDIFVLFLGGLGVFFIFQYLKVKERNRLNVISMKYDLHDRSLLEKDMRRIWRNKEKEYEKEYNELLSEIEK